MRLAMEKVTDAVLEAGLSHTKPEEQVKACINAHLNILLSESDMVYVLLFEWRSLQGDAGREMLELRDRYESHFIQIINQLPLARGTNRRLLRLMLLGALNSTRGWYREGDKSAKVIGRSFVKLLKEPASD